MKINNTKEQWTRWKPINILAEKYYIDSIFDDGEKLTIILLEEKNKKNEAILIFDNAISYKETNKDFKLELINNLTQKYGSNFHNKWAFFKIDNSNYIKWTLEQSYNIYDDVPFMHFSFIGIDSVLDIVATGEPNLELNYEDQTLDEVEKTINEEPSPLKIGTLADGSIAIVRAKTKEGRPILEIQNNKERKKIRYGNDNN